jgi:hypothetical protein
MRFALIGAIALLVLTGYANAQQRQLQQPRNQPNQQQAAPDNRGTDQVPLVVKELPHERSQEEKAEIKNKEELDRKLTDYTSDLAFFTKGLFIATLLLAGVTGWLAWAAGRQLKEARKSIAATVTLAKAAETTTRHIERPYLFVSSITGEYIFQSRNLAIILSGGKEKDKTPNTLHFTCVFRNYGRTPAIVERTYFDIFIWEIGIGPVDITSQPPKDPAYNPTGGSQDYKIVGSGENLEPIVRNVSLSAEMIGEMRGFFNRKWPLVFGYIRYRDVAGRRYQRGFGFNFLGSSFGIHTPEYNYDRELKPGEEEDPPEIPEPPEAA